MPVWLDRIGNRCVRKTDDAAAGAASSLPVAHIPRVGALDMGRALAIVGVILVHLALFMHDLPAWLKSFADMGQYGVQLFFVISAVTIMLTLEDDTRRFGDDRSLIARRFYVKRFFRIAPLYYVAVAVYAAGNHLAGLVGAQITAPHDMADVLANLAFIHAWVPTAVNTVVPGGWSIGVEMCFYLFAPFIFAAIRTRGGLWRVSIVLLAFSALALAALACTDGVCHVDNNSFLYYWPPTQLPCFIIGFWLARYGRRLLTRDGVMLSGFGLMCALGGVALMLALLYATGSGLGHAHWLAPTVAACAAALLLLLLAQLPVSWPGARFVASFGQNSYGLYVWSFIAIMMVRFALKTPLDAIDHALPVLSFALATVFTCTVSYAAARISAARIELPCTQWARVRLLPRVEPATVIERVVGRELD